MKRLLFVMLMMTCSVSWAEWELVAKGNESSTFVDKSTIRKSGNVVKMWSMRNFALIKTVGKSNYRSTAILDAYDCKEEATAVVSISAFEGEMASGKSVVTETYQQREWDWQPVIPGSTGRTQWEIACSRQ